METLTIKLRNKKAFIKLLVLENEKLISFTKLSPQQKFKRKICKNVVEGLKLVKLAEEGKIKLKSADELFNEL